ncbi:metallopeptidase family protein [Ornithinimicrobium sp. Arc0846-15]|uniref:metallopeptidase family protein n=1 Tax=Ornithinimicrobium sp. INDO-MA30-4 TaxID=2908651 RepID=UPI001C67D63D|nr:metallopeptidase family protein [Ornithinimicrobium sp. INDO-MA30-4]MBW8173673.1 metallopeptidase family protein [Ornithinimicrobium laminariae]UJH71602.1 metallopeptidase family protein [Ornithinimicrobium sp. INDO-MA30-4]
MVSRSRRFDETVLDAIHRVAHRAPKDVVLPEIAVEDVPPSDPAPWEDSVPLGRLFPAQGHNQARLVIYRRPVEAAARSWPETEAVVLHVVAEQIAQMAGIDPEDLL